MESAVATLYKQACASTLIVEGNIIRDKAFIITVCFGGDNFTGSDGLIKR